MARPLSFHLRPHRNSASATSNSSSPSAATTTPASSAAASTTLQNTSHNPTSDQKPDPAAVIAESRAEIRAKTKDDWEYPSTTGDNGGSESGLRIEENTRYVVRTEDPLTPSRSPSPPPMMYAGAQVEKDPYRFQGPDEVGREIEEGRKRKRREEREEWEANEGLRVFEARRNAWTGAVRVKGRRREWPEGLAWGKREVLEAAVNNELDNNGSSNTLESGSKDETTSTTDDTTPTRPLQTNGHTHLPTSTQHRSSISPPPSTAQAPETPTPPPSTPSTPTTLTPSSGPPPTTTLIPIAPPLLPPTHPTRALISPAAYPSFYSRIIVQGTSPKLPIPLQDIVGSCVAGWKADGEWPPKPNPGGPEPLVGRRRKGGVKDGFGRGVRRVLRIVGGRGQGQGHGQGHGQGGVQEYGGVRGAEEGLGEGGAEERLEGLIG